MENQEIQLKLRMLSVLVSFEEAKFMLVACSAFVNYIQGKRTV